MDLQLQTHAFQLSKEAFFYAYKEITKEESHHLFLESGRGGHLSVAAWNPLAVTKSVKLVYISNGEMEKKRNVREKHWRN